MGSGNDQHDHRTCRDQECERYACRIYREGYRDGYDDGNAAGYAAGFIDGLASCPGPHGE